jgi:uncharacterized integral membrane protein
MKGPAVWRLLSWIIMVPVALAVISFAVNNRAGVRVDLWPAPFAVEAPLFAVVLASLVGGVVIGALIAWLSGGRSRHRARTNAKRAAAAEQELSGLRQRLGDIAGDGPETEPQALPAHRDGV